MTIDDAIALQREVLTAQLAIRLADERLATPPCFAISPMPSGNLHVHLAGGPHAPGQPIIQINEAWTACNPGATVPRVLDEIHAAAHLAIRRAAQAHPKQEMPSWAVLVHPVLLAAMLAHEPDRTRMPVRGETCRDLPDGRWDTDPDGSICHAGRIGNATGDIWLAEGVMQAASFGSLMQMGGVIAAMTVCSIPHVSMPHIGHTSLALPALLPETTLAAIAGRRFGEIVSLPPTGWEEVDRAAAECVVTGYKELPNGIDLDFAPARLIPYGVPPTPELAQAMSLSPLIG